MASGINVNIASDTRNFAAGVKSGIIDPIKNAQDTLDKLGAAGQTAGDKLEGAFRDEQTATDHLKSKIDDLNDNIKTKTAGSASSMSKHFKESASKTEEGFSEMKDSARQNAMETAASFNGGFDSISGGLQGMLAEFMAGFGPAGMIAGLVLAGGVGLLTSAIDGMGQETDTDKGKVADLAKEFQAAGNKGKRSFDDVTTAIQDMMDTSSNSDAIISLQKAWDLSKSAGADYSKIVDSIAEADPRQIGKAQAAVDKLKKAHTDAGIAANTQGRMSGQAEDRAATAAGDLGKALAKAKKQAQEAQDAADLAARAGLSSFQRKKDLIDQLSGKYHDAAGAAQDYEDTESGLFNVNKYIAAMKKRQQALHDYQDTLLKAKLTPEAQSFIESLGEDDAAAMMEGYKKASPKQKKQLDEIWTSAGTSNAHSYKQAIGADLHDWKVKVPPLMAPNSEAYQRAVRDAHAKAEAYLKAHPLQAGYVAYTSYGKPIPG